MTATADPLPPRPQPPRDEDCCRSDCPNCVFNLYERELERWQERVAALHSAGKACKSGMQSGTCQTLTAAPDRTPT
ncbi:MAG: oxidoreductase-like domain-containing protein [Panacagrimonas sp.]